MFTSTLCRIFNFSGGILREQVYTALVKFLPDSIWHSHLGLPFHLTFSPESISPSDGVQSASPWSVPLHCGGKVSPWFHLTFSSETTIPSDILIWNYHSIWHSHLKLPFHLTFSPKTNILPDILTWEYIPIRRCPVCQSMVGTITLRW